MTEPKQDDGHETVERLYSDKGRQRIPRDYGPDDMRQATIIFRSKWSRVMIGVVVGLCLLFYVAAMVGIFPGG